MVERVLRESGHDALFLAESRPHPRGSLGRLWNRVTLDGYPAWRIGPELELMPSPERGAPLLRDNARMA